MKLIWLKFPYDNDDDHLYLDDGNDKYSSSRKSVLITIFKSIPFLYLNEWMNDDKIEIQENNWNYGMHLNSSI